MFARGNKVAVMSMDGKNRASCVSILSRIQPVMRDGRGGGGKKSPRAVALLVLSTQR